MGDYRYIYLFILLIFYDFYMRNGIITNELFDKNLFYKQFNAIHNKDEFVNLINKIIKVEYYGVNVKNNIRAFSLIELSIVLIIIGLLVAGVTGGASLVESAKIRSFLNETNSWRQALYAFQVAYNRLPGDLNNDGFTGSWCAGASCPLGSEKSAEIYSTNSFPSPYNKSVPISWTGSFIDLYLANISDYYIDPVSPVKPSTTMFPDLVWSFHQFVSYNNNKPSDWLYDIKGHSLWMVSDVKISYKKGYLDMFKKIDTKIDDFDYDGSGAYKGRFRYRQYDHDEGNRFAMHLIDL